MPDCVIGDFDSTNTDDRFDCLYITYPAEKDLTDSEACLFHAIEKKYDDIEIFGGIGGRLDHTLGNISLLSEFYQEGRSIRFVDSKNSITLLRNGSLKLFPDKYYKYFSIISLDEYSNGVSIIGAKYPLDDIILKRASTLGISNELAADKAVVTVRDGTLVIVRSSDF